jgi:hypothetical protein
MAITLTDRLVSRFQQRSRMQEAPRTRIRCVECGTTNRRILEPRDDRCWNCDGELSRQDVTVRA